MNIRDFLRSLSRERAWLTAAALLALGCALRLWALGALPYGLNQDEASAGYEAWALLHSGVDRCGKAWPLLFVSWGSGQNVLMSYLAMPFVALLGLSPLSLRLPNALAGCLSLFVFWRLARRTRGERFALWALLLLAVNPWHIMASRWALESNLLPALLLTGLWCVSLSSDRPWALCGAAACFGLSLYAYGTAFFFLPPFLVWLLLRQRRELRPGPTVCAGALFALLAFPIALCQLRSALGLGDMTLLGFTLPELTQGRQSAASVLGGGGLREAWENFRTALEILRRGTDGLRYNALPLRQGGLLYCFGLPLAVVGVVVSVLQRRDTQAEWPLRAALGCALLCAFFIRGNINRLNMLWLPLVYYSALGAHFLTRRLRLWALLPAAAVGVFALIFWGAYRESFRAPGDGSYFPGLGAAIECAQRESAGTVYVTDRVNMPYIFALFYTRVPPEDFAASVVYRNPDGAFRRVDRFTGFAFDDPAGCDVLVLPAWDGGGREELGRFGNYVVVKGDA